jgi:type VI secretion system secreted protein VgrG
MADIHTIALPSMTIDGKSYRVLRYELTEGLSEVSALSCDLQDEAATLPRPAEVTGKRASFALTRSDGSASRAFVGNVIEAELTPDAMGVPSLRVSVAPSLWALGKRASSRVFQEESVASVVKKVLEGAGVPASAQEWLLDEAPAPRLYITQYRETDLDFVRRLLSEEGITFAIHVRDEQEVVIFSDAPDGIGEADGAASLPFREEFGGAGAADCVMRVEQTLSVRSDKAFVRDYNPEKPSLKLEGAAEGQGDGPRALEIYAWPARAAEEGLAKQRASVLLASVEADRDLVTCETGSLALLPGLRFGIDGHPYDPLNRAYLVVSARIVGSHPGPFAGGASARPSTFRSTVVAVPEKTTRYRPPRRPRAQTLPGVQTAITTGPPGEEIHTDEAGRVKIQYHWDREGKRDDKSSLWIRTLQLPLGGSMLLPRVGWEVLVAHEDGDVDRPMVLGRMYNALTPPPYALPKHAGRSAIQTATTPGGGSVNEMRMSDEKGAEQMSLNASKDMTSEVKNNVTESVANNALKKVGGNQTKNVTNSMTASVGADQKLTVSGNQSIKAETFMVDEVGSHTLTIGGNRDMKVGGDHKRDVGGDSSLKVSGNQIDLVVGSVTDETMAAFNHDVGAALVELSVGHRTVTVVGDRSETAGAAKIIAVNGGRGVSVGTSMNVKVGGAIVNVASFDRIEAAGGSYTEVAAGAQIVKANNVVFQADGALTLVMGASILSLTPESVTVIGVSVKLDGDVADEGVLVVDN